MEVGTIQMASRSAFHDLIHTPDIDEETFKILLESAPINLSKDLLFHKNLPANLRIPLIKKVYSAKDSEISCAVKLDYFSRLLRSRDWDLHSREVLSSKIRRLENFHKNNIAKVKSKTLKDKKNQSSLGLMKIPVKNTHLVTRVTPYIGSFSYSTDAHHVFQKLTEVSNLFLRTYRLGNHEDLVNQTLLSLKYDFMLSYFSDLKLSTTELDCLWRLFTLQISQLKTSYDAVPEIIDQFSLDLRLSLNASFRNDINQECMRISHPAAISMRIAFRILVAGRTEEFYSQVFSRVTNLSSNFEELLINQKPIFSDLALVQAGSGYLTIRYFGNMASKENQSYLKYVPAGDDMDLAGWPQSVEATFNSDFGRIEYRGTIKNLKAETEYLVKIVSKSPEHYSYPTFQFTTVKVPIRILQATSSTEGSWWGNNSRYRKGG